jgi:hypothetical protein
MFAWFLKFDAMKKLTEFFNGRQKSRKSLDRINKIYRIMGKGFLTGVT